MLQPAVLHICVDAIMKKESLMKEFSYISKLNCNQVSHDYVFAKKNPLFFKPVIQPKLTINQPNDIYEQEADAMAERVMRMPMNDQSFFSAKQIPVPGLLRKCNECEGEEKKLQRQQNSNDEGVASHELEDYIGNLNTSGKSLPDSVKSFFEPRFGSDFSDVRIHTDSAAAKSAQSINALAYTSRNNIVFNHNQFSPETESGKKLMAHELTHVLQQGNSVIRRYGHDNFCSTSKHLEPFIWPGHAEAANMLKNILEAFRNNDPRLNTYIPKFFGKKGVSRISDIQTNYTSINNKLHEHYLYHCNDSSNSNSNAMKCKGQRAETDINGWRPSKNITLCFDVINQNWTSTDVGALIIHENYHRAFGSSNHPWLLSGNPPDCSNNAVAEQSDLLLDNPDSYSCLAIIFR